MTPLLSILAFLLALYPELCCSAVGVSLSKKLTLQGWAALKSTVAMVDFAMIHFQFYNGSTNPHAPSTIEAAWNSNITDVSFYMHPCMNTSVYSQSFKIQCGTAREQLQTILETMYAHDMAFVRHTSVNEYAGASQVPSITPTATPTTHMPSADPSLTPTASPSVSVAHPTARPTTMPTASPTNTHAPSTTVTAAPSVTAVPSVRPTAVPTSATSSAVQIKRLFVCFEDEVPNRYHSMTHGENVQFLLDLTVAASSQGIQLGVYTTKNDWLNTMTDKVNGQAVYTINGTHNATNPFTDLPLWIPRFDSINSMDFYAPFAGWDRVLMKQVSGSTTALHRIGSDRVGMNYLDEDVAVTYYDNQILEYTVV